MPSKYSFLEVKKQKLLEKPIENIEILSPEKPIFENLEETQKVLK